MYLRKCVCCKSNRALPPIGIHRKNSKKTHFDWKTRKLHKKCYIHLKKQNKIPLDLNNSNHVNKLQIIKKYNPPYDKSGYYIYFPKKPNDLTSIETIRFYILINNFYKDN